MIRFLIALMCCGLGFVFSIGVLAFTGQIPRPYLDRAIDQVPAGIVPWIGMAGRGIRSPANWPPQTGAPYPDLELTNQFGERVRLRDYAGKVILVELAAIPCKGCQAFAGGNERGDFGGFGVQPGLESIHTYAERFAGVTLGEEPDLVFVQLLLYGRKLSSPTPEEVGGWAGHFKLNGNPNLVVLRGEPALLGRETHRRIPGFQLIDRDFTLRMESSGHQPQHDLYRDLLPEMGKLLGREPTL